MNVGYSGRLMMPLWIFGSVGPSKLIVARSSQTMQEVGWVARCEQALQRSSPFLRIRDTWRDVEHPLARVNL